MDLFLIWSVGIYITIIVIYGLYLYWGFAKLGMKGYGGSEPGFNWIRTAIYIGVIIMYSVSSYASYRASLECKNKVNEKTIVALNLTISALSIVWIVLFVMKKYFLITFITILIVAVSTVRVIEISYYSINIAWLSMIYIPYLLVTLAVTGFPFEVGHCK